MIEIGIIALLAVGYGFVIYCAAVVLTLVATLLQTVLGWIARSAGWVVDLPGTVWSAITRA